MQRWRGELVLWGGGSGCRLHQEARTLSRVQALLGGELLKEEEPPGFLLCPGVERGLSGCFVDEGLRGTAVQGSGCTKHF